MYILDAGHGIDTYIEGLNPYRKSEVWADGSQLLEYEFTRNVVSYLSYMLREAGIKYHVLIDTEKDVSLSDRIKKANEFGKDSVFISVHSNWYINPTVHGLETHYYSAGLNIAKTFQKHLGKLGRDRGVKKSSFSVIKKTIMPAILTENGFYSNEKECKKLLTPEFQYKIAEAHFMAIKEIETNKNL
jgi:N-acetylmuramoyl-L-alanine amidase